MPVPRRLELLKRAEAEDFLIIEDDYEFEMSFLEPPSPSLKSLDSSGRVIYVGSFSKSIFPGLRVGYLVASEPFIEQARALRAIMLRHPPTHMQRVTAYFLALGHYDAHIVGLRDVLKKRRSALVKALSDHEISIAGAARYGGSSLWVAAPDQVDSLLLSKNLAGQGVLIEPGYPFFSEPKAHRNYFRMGYSSISADKIPPGVQIIRSCIEQSNF
jgi:GntR family transcriptional regulator/MocR family aminotransferase